ncbi:putative DNA-binding domain-containing protein [Lysobacter sp. A6]|uniref:DNA-binding domain-containing protein n=1 Tax=Noviluteimonas lactosilytica TaxID=2888523 RepID=A0ABS8JJE3_9GAMM|nr:putative DNA-binding domain-containing protein [Lysobacter lactosilyticus]MCC8363654.1 putative DNA-binding domain-containing protein [Lysobacter lactosilyticus]
MSDTLRDQQFAFTAHLRDPVHHAAPTGIEERRLAVYRDLLFNSLEGLLASKFPVIKQTLGEEAWRDLVRAFYATHRCATPLFTEVGAEFVDYLGAPSLPRTRESWPAWLPELAHYEYLELAVSISDDPLPAHDPDGDLLDGTPLLSPHARPVAYAWPVHRIGPDHQPDAPPDHPTLLLVRRDPAGDVHFSELSPLTFRLLQLLEAADATGREVLETLADEAAAPDRAAFLRDGARQFQQLRLDAVLLGTAPRC